MATRILEATEFLPENFWLTLRSRDLKRRLNETAFYEKVSQGLMLTVFNGHQHKLRPFGLFLYGFIVNYIIFYNCSVFHSYYVLPLVCQTITKRVDFTHSLGLQVDSDLRSYVGKLVEAAANKGYDGEKDDNIS